MLSQASLTPRSQNSPVCKPSRGLSACFFFSVEKSTELIHTRGLPVHGVTLTPNLLFLFVGVGGMPSSTCGGQRVTCWSSPSTTWFLGQTQVVCAWHFYPLSHLTSPKPVLANGHPPKPYDLVKPNKNEDWPSLS